MSAPPAKENPTKDSIPAYELADVGLIVKHARAEAVQHLGHVHGDVALIVAQQRLQQPCRLAERKTGEGSWGCATAMMGATETRDKDAQSRCGRPVDQVFEQPRENLMIGLR